MVLDAEVVNYQDKGDGARGVAEEAGCVSLVEGKALEEGDETTVGAVEEEMREDGAVGEGGNQVGVKNLGVGRVGRLYKRGAPAERTVSDREARARPMSEAERSGRALGGRGRVVDEGEDGWGMRETLKNFPFPLLPPPPPTTLIISPFVGERGGEVGMGIGREAERDTIRGWKGSAKGLVKRGWWVGSTGNGSRLRD